MLLRLGFLGLRHDYASSISIQDSSLGHLIASIVFVGRSDNLKNPALKNFPGVKVEGASS